MRPFPKQAKVILFPSVTLRLPISEESLRAFFCLPKGLFRQNPFCETFLSSTDNSIYFQINLFLKLAFWYLLLREFPLPFTKREDTMKQLGLIPAELLPPKVQYDLLFENLPSLSLTESHLGRPSFSRDALLKAFIYKALRRLKTLSDLAFELKNNSTVCQAVGLDPYRKPPSIERFSQFIRETPHALLEGIRIRLVHCLLKEAVIAGHHLAMDSCPILAKVRENNLKTSASQRFEKTKRPKGDPDARLGILVHFPSPSQKKIRYFWGYRNHILVDAENELPLWEITHPADISEVHQAIFLLRKAKETFSISIQIVSGDALYDSENILRFIIEDLKAQAIVPRNPRGEQHRSYTQKGNLVYCQADLPMRRKGKMTVKKAGITYLQYACPIYFGKERQRHLLCPAAHPKFTSQKGCNVLIRLTPSIRERIDYGTMSFTELQKKRTSVERIFSRLLAISMQDLPVTGINAVKNYCTIAHITVLLVALAAKRSGHPDKTRFVRSFVPNSF